MDPTDPASPDRGEGARLGSFRPTIQGARIGFDFEVAPMISWMGRGLTLADETRARVMGILNVTPDSFSDGGRSATLDDALRTAERLVSEGADLIDVGGESSRPGAAIVPTPEELARVIPVIEAIARRLSVPISVDTTKPEVARRALEAGAAVINDIQGLDNPEMIDVVAGTEAGVVLMHMQGTPQTMQDDPRYQDVVREVHDDLARKVEAAVRRGIARSRIAIDPGIGFGKTHDHNLDLLRNLDAFAGIGCTLLVGTSRKGFLGQLTGRPRGERVVASVASALAAVAGGALVVRVHDVGPTVDALKVWEAQRIRSRSMEPE